MNTKKIIIGAGVGAILAWGWWMYSKRKGSTDLVSDDMDASQRMSNGDFPDAEPIGDTVSDEGMKAPELEVQEELPNGTVEEGILETMPVAEPPTSFTPPITTRPAVQAKPQILIKEAPITQVQPISEPVPITQTVSRISAPLQLRTASIRQVAFSGMDGEFDGGGNYVEVGSELTDLD